MMTSITFTSGKFELSDSDAIDCVASKVLGDEKFTEIRRKTVTLTRGMSNDRLVDEVFRILNHPLVKLAIRLVK